jgi:hypothetical protein
MVRPTRSGLADGVEWALALVPPILRDNSRIIFAKRGTQDPVTYRIEVIIPCCTAILVGIAVKQIEYRD